MTHPFHIYVDASGIKRCHAGSAMDGLKKQKKQLNSNTNREDLDLAGKYTRMFCTDRQESQAGVYPIFLKRQIKKKIFRC
jgi:hypothetical protein